MSLLLPMVPVCTGAIEYLDKNPKTHADLVDLRTLSPLDTEAILNSVRKTGKAIILQEDVNIGSIGSDISALISENCFEVLDAPVVRVSSLDTPVPFAKNLEEGYLAKSRFAEKLKALLDY